MHSPTRWLAPVALALAVLLSSCDLLSGGDDTPGTEDPQETLEGDRIATSQGELILRPINHATFLMYWRGKAIYVDPVGGAERFQGLPPPALILVTDIHADHYSADTLAALFQPGTVIVAPKAVRDMMPATVMAVTRELANGQTLTEAGIPLEAVPMYNITEGRLTNHPKGRGNGYVLTLGDKRVYIAGDTEATAELRALKNIDVAFIPMNLPFTMSVDQAADGVRAFKPKIVYPYHHRNSDVNEFARLVGTDVGVEVRQRTWY